MNKIVTLVIHLTQKSKYIIKMFAIHPFPFISQCMRKHFREVWECAIRYVTNCDMLYNILFGDNVNYHSKTFIWNGSHPNYKVTIMCPTLSHLFFVIHCRLSALNPHSYCVLVRVKAKANMYPTCVCDLAFFIHIVFPMQSFIFLKFYLFRSHKVINV